MIIQFRDIQNLERAAADALETTPPHIVARHLREMEEALIDSPHRPSDRLMGMLSGYARGIFDGRTALRAAGRRVA